LVQREPVAGEGVARDDAFTVVHTAIDVSEVQFAIQTKISL